MELDKFASRYDFGSGIVITIISDGGSLYAQKTPVDVLKLESKYDSTDGADHFVDVSGMYYGFAGPNTRTPRDPL